MKAVIKKAESGKIVLEGRASAAEVSAALDESIVELAYELHVRPQEGKSTKELVEERLQVPDVDRVVSDRALARLVPYVLDKHDIHPLAQPKAVLQGSLKRGFELRFDVMVKPKPEYSLASYEPVEVEVEPFEFDESVVDEQLAHIVERFVDFVAAEPHPVGASDHCFISLEVRIDGEHDARFDTDGRVYSMGRGFMPREFDDALIGMVPGETREVSFAGEYTAKNGMPATGDFSCTVHLIELREKVVPALADEWVSEHVEGFDTLDEYRAAVRESLMSQQREAYERDVRNKVVEKFAERFEGKIDQEAFDATYNAILSDMKHAVLAQGEDFVEYVNKMGGEVAVEEAIEIRTRMTLAQDYCLDALFRHLDLKIEECDYLEAGLEMNPNDPQGVRERMEASGRGFALREVAARNRAARWLADNSTLRVKGA